MMLKEPSTSLHQRNLLILSKTEASMENTVLEGNPIQELGKKTDYIELNRFWSFSQDVKPITLAVLEGNPIQELGKKTDYIELNRF